MNLATKARHEAKRQGKSSAWLIVLRYWRRFGENAIIDLKYYNLK